MRYSFQTSILAFGLIKGVSNLMSTNILKCQMFTLSDLEIHRYRRFDIRTILYSWIALVFIGAGVAKGTVPHKSGLSDGHLARPAELMVNNLVEPLAIADRHPTFMWIMKGGIRGDYQTAYQLMIGPSRHFVAEGNGNTWNSGKILSNEQVDISYAGQPLKSETEYFWRVRIWNKNGRKSPWSAISKFATGMLKASVWQGEFIGKRGYQLYRKAFYSSPTKHIKHALLYIGSWGVPVVYIDGVKVGSIVLDAADGVMEKTTWYRGFDATGLIHSGSNAVGVMMGNGELGRQYGSPSDLKFILNLVIRCSDGSSEVIASDGSWRATKDGPLMAGELNNVMDGEKFDARKMQDQSGWDRPGFNDAQWKLASRVVNISEPENTLKPQLTPPMRIVETYSPKRITEVFPGKYTVDAGKIVTGWVRLTADGDPGDKIDLRYAETRAHLWNNYTFRFTIRIVKKSAGVLFRAADEDNYYEWEFEPGELLFCKKAGGVLSVIGKKPFDFKPNADYRIQIEAEQSTIRTFCNNKLLSSLQDKTFKSGKVGFRESDGDTAIFSEITLMHRDSILLKSDGANPDLWLHNHNVRIVNNRLEVWSSNYLVSRFGNVNGGIDQTSLCVPGFVYNAMGSGARQHDIYIHGYNAAETWEPFQTLHGFRYVQIKGFNGRLRKSSVQIRVVRQAIQQRGESVGTFKCSNELVNKLYSISLRSFKNNLQWGIPTGCTGRDERDGWTGDAEQQSQEGYYYTNMTPFYNQWLLDMRETQHSDGYIDNIAPREMSGPEIVREEDIPWSSASINVPWDMYVATGEKTIIEQQYDCMKRFIDWCVATSNLSKSKGGKKDYTTDKDCWGDYGSIVEMKSCCPIPMPQKSLYATAFYYHSVVRLSVLADSLGNTAEAEKLAKLAPRIKESYNAKFLRTNKNGSYSYLCNTQTDDALSLAFGLCPSEKVKADILRSLVSSLREDHYRITMGVLGLYAVYNALCQNGFTEVAYRMITQTSYPSWGYWIKHGATTCWEFWSGRGSRDHGFLGGRLNAFLVKYLAGISPISPGYGRIRIEPGVVCDLKNAEARVYSVRGLVSSDWSRKSSTSLDLKVHVPPNATAAVFVPLLKLKSSEAIVQEGSHVVFDKGAGTPNRYVSYVGKKHGCLAFKVGSGNYEFKLRPN